jgi:hypothetical protein
LPPPLGDQGHVLLMGPASEVRLLVTEVISTDVPPTNLANLLCGFTPWRRAQIAPLRWAWQGLSQQLRLATSAVHVLDEVVDVPGGLALRPGCAEQVVRSTGWCVIQPNEPATYRRPSQQMPDHGPEANQRSARHPVSPGVSSSGPLRDTSGSAGSQVLARRRGCPFVPSTPPVQSGPAQRTDRAAPKRVDSAAGAVPEGGFRDTWMSRAG